MENQQVINNITDIRSTLNEIRTPPGSYFIGNFDGKDRFLRYDLNAFAELENRYGSMDNVEKLMSSASMKDLRTLLWVGLLHDGAEIDPHTGDVIKYNITQYQVGSWITAQNMGDLMKNVNSAFSTSVPTELQTAPALLPATPALSSDIESGTGVNAGDSTNGTQGTYSGDVSNPNL